MMWEFPTPFPLPLVLPAWNPSFTLDTRENCETNHVTPLVVIPPQPPFFFIILFKVPRDLITSPTSFFTVPIFVLQQIARSTLSRAGSCLCAFDLALFYARKAPAQLSTYRTPCPGSTSSRNPSLAPFLQVGFEGPLSTPFYRLPLS